MITHMSNQGTTRSVCKTTVEGDKVSSNIDRVDCVECLRRLVKDAVKYGNGRSAERSTAYRAAFRKDL